MQAVGIRIKIHIDREEVLCELGYDASHAPARMVALVDDYLNNFDQLLDPAFSYAVKDVYRVNGGYTFLERGFTLKSEVLANLFKNCSKVCVFAATIGPHLEESAYHLAKDGQVVQATVLDAIGSLAAEKVADHLQELVRRRVAAEGLTVSRRFGPGHCDWPVEEQWKLFALLEPHHADIQLTDECLMLPRKSLSGVFGIGKDIEQVARYDPCKTCSQAVCHGRRYSLKV